MNKYAIYEFVKLIGTYDPCYDPSTKVVRIELLRRIGKGSQDRELEDHNTDHKITRFMTVDHKKN